LAWLARECKDTMNEHTRPWTLGLVVGLLLLSAALVWHDLGTREVLGQDENATITKLDQPNLKAVLDVTYMKVTGQPGNMQPLYFLVQHLFWPLVGFSAFMLRFLPSLFALLTVAVTYKLGEALYNSKVGLVGALLVALLPLQVHYAQIARPYSLLALLSLTSAYFLVRALATNRPLHWLGFTLAATLNFYTHFNSLFVLAVEGICAGTIWLFRLDAVLKRRQPVARLVGPALGFLAVVLLCLPGAIRLLGLPWTGEGGKITVELTVPFFARFLYRIGLTSGWLRGSVLGLMAVGLLATMYRRDWRAAFFTVLWLVVPFVVLAVMKSPRPFAERYLIFVPSVALLLAAQGVVAAATLTGRLLHLGKARVVRRTVAVLLSLGLALLFVSPLRAYYGGNLAYGRLDLTLEVVERHASPGDLVLVSPRFLVRPLAADGADVIYLADHLAPAELEKLVAAHQRTWVLYTSYLPPAELQEPLDQWLQARPDDFVRVPIKAITALAYHNQALTDREAMLKDRVSILQELAEVSADDQEAWLRYEALAETYDSLSELYDGRGETGLAVEYRDKAEQARATAPRPW
jgi:4-amino-4-deoxy-L-arabinose transferase-like glycosyltransferase